MYKVKLWYNHKEDSCYMYFYDMPHHLAVKLSWWCHTGIDESLSWSWEYVNDDV